MSNYFFFQKRMKSVAKLFLLGIVLCTTQAKEKRYRCNTKVPYFFNDHQSKSAQQRIVGGEKAPSMIPWQVSLKFLHPSYGSMFHYCGGTILDEKTILTAAHCKVWKGDKVLAGQTGTNGKTIEVIGVVKNPYNPFNETSLNNDVLILKLAQSLEFSDKIQPACLPKRKFFPPNGTICYASGWGTKKYGGSQGPMVLQYAAIPLISNQDCSIKYTNVTGITENMICAGREGVDSCQGDSGGPLVCIDQDKPIITGIVSFGVGCGWGEFPGVYARVTSFMRWIKAQMEYKRPIYG